MFPVIITGSIPIARIIIYPFCSIILVTLRGFSRTPFVRIWNRSIIIPTAMIIPYCLILPLSSLATLLFIDIFSNQTNLLIISSWVASSALISPTNAPSLMIYILSHIPRISGSSEEINKIPLPFSASSLITL